MSSGSVSVTGWSIAVSSGTSALLSSGQSVRSPSSTSCGLSTEPSASIEKRKPSLPVS